MKNVEVVCVLMWAHADSKEQAGLVKRSHMPKKNNNQLGKLNHPRQTETLFALRKVEEEDV